MLRKQMQLWLITVSSNKKNNFYFRLAVVLLWYIRKLFVLIFLLNFDELAS